MQTSYSNKQPIGLHGGWYAAHESPDVVSYSAEVPADVLDGTVTGEKGIPFGRVVSLGTNENDQVKLGDPDTKGAFGISVREISREIDCCEPFAGYKHQETVAVNRSGYQYITCPEGCNAGDPVDFDPATGEMHNGGGGTVLPNARWEFQTAAGELGVVRLAGGA